MKAFTQFIIVLVVVTKVYNDLKDNDIMTAQHMCSGHSFLQIPAPHNMY